MATEDLLTRLFNGVLLRDPTAEEAEILQEKLDIGLVTPLGLVMEGAALPEFTEVSHMIVSLHQAAFGRYGSMQELMAWRQVYDAGVADPAGLGDIFIGSREFTRDLPNTDTATILDKMARVGLGQELSAEELAPYVDMVESGQTSYGDLLWQIVQVNERGIENGLSMLAAGLAESVGTGKPFAVPTDSGKAVILTADIVGDTSIWYLVNQVTPTEVSAEELTEVTQLQGVNNLGLGRL